MEREEAEDEDATLAVAVAVAGDEAGAIPRDSKKQTNTETDRSR